jgi:hypothetical protein
MADQKITQLTDIGVPASTDILPVVSSPASSPVTKKVTSNNLFRVWRPWAGKIAAAFADGDPYYMISQMNALGSAPVNPTPTNITTSIARISYFILPADMTVNTIRYWGVGATTNIYRVALYKYSDLSRLMAETAFTTAANSWGAIGGGTLNISLLAGIVYFIAVSVNTTGTTAGIRSFTVAPAGGDWLTTLPSARPGNLDIDSGLFAGALGQFAVTTGALPNPAATLAVAGAWTGGMPAFFLDSV